MNDLARSSDEQLMQLIQRRSEPAFNVLYVRYHRRLLLFLYKMLPQDEAKAQDVFLKVVEAPKKFDTSRPFKTWVFAVAANGCRNYFRAQKTARLANERLPTPDTTTTPVVASAVLEEQLRKALQQLTPIYSVTFLLKYKEGLSLKEIAAVLDCPLGTVKSRLHAATTQLAQQLAPYKKSFL